MTLFFLDVNVWLALSDYEHPHRADATGWLNRLPDDASLAFSRFTQMALLRLLTNKAVMGDGTLTLGEAWKLYDRWLEDPRVEFYSEPRDFEPSFRQVTKPFASQPATKVVGDCWLLSFAEASRAQLVTFDQALHRFARKQGNRAVIPA